MCHKRYHSLGLGPNIYRLYEFLLNAFISFSSKLISNGFLQQKSISKWFFPTQLTNYQLML